MAATSVLLILVFDAREPFCTSLRVLTCSTSRSNKIVEAVLSLAKAPVLGKDAKDTKDCAGYRARVQRHPIGQRARAAPEHAPETRGNTLKHDEDAPLRSASKTTFTVATRPFGAAHGHPSTSQPSGRDVCQRHKYGDGRTSWTVDPRSPAHLHLAPSPHTAPFSTCKFQRATTSITTTQIRP